MVAVAFYKSSMHTSELCYPGLESTKRNIHKEGHGCLHFNNQDNTLAGSVNLPTTSITVQMRWQ